MVLLVAVAAGGALLGSRLAGPVGTPVTVGRFTFRMPVGWQNLRCPGPPRECVRVLPDPGDLDDAIFVGFMQLNSVEGDPSDLLLDPDLALGGVPRLKVDGLPAIRVEDAYLRAVLMVGPLPDGKFVVYCGYRSHEAQIRKGCDLVVQTLEIRR